MKFFEIESTDITALNDADLRELIGRLCEAELVQQNIQPSCVLWGGAQEAPDGGFDVHIKESTKLCSPGFVPRENTGFQVKKNSMSKAACTKEMLEKGKLKLTIAKLASQNGAYIIVSGKDDCSDKMLSERLLGMNNAVECLPNKDNILLDFYGRDRLVTWLRQYPGVSLWVRSRLGKPLSGWAPFGRWTTAPLDQKDEFLFDDFPCVMEANSRTKEPISAFDGIKLVRKKLRITGSTVRITGLSGVGKTRFVQALFEAEIGENALPSSNVIYADLGEDISPTASELVSYLIANDFAAYVILDNCPPDVHRNLQKKISLSNPKLSLLTIEYDISDDRPEETEVIHLEPFSEETVSKLIQKRFPDLGHVNADIVAEFAGGNARIAIALASRVDADETLTNFSDEDLFQRLFFQRKGKSCELLECARILSLVYSFNISPLEYNDELSVLAAIGGFDRQVLNRSHAELMQRQLLQQRGNWRAVLPHALANRLARRALQYIAPNEINSVLFKPENLRLLKSCAHRLGYLHDFEPARQLTNTWLQMDGPLHDIVSCDKNLLTVLTYIAPVSPNTVLTAIETASNDPIFVSKENKHIFVIVKLLKQIAYDDKNFDRAVNVMLKFAELEKVSGDNNNVISPLRSLFSLHLSGTQAIPKRRQAFLGRLLTSNNSKHREIASELFHSALNTSQWVSSDSWGFGARKRDSGWVPKTRQEQLKWYVGFINLLKSSLMSSNEQSKKLAKDLLADHFRGLWSFAGCFNILEEIVRDYASGGRWPEMWISIKQTISWDGEEHTPELRTRLEALERLASPSDLFSEIEAYVFITTRKHINLMDKNYQEKSKEVRDKIMKLGELVASKPECLKKLAPRLWEKKIDALWPFGAGIAKGSADQNATFEFLVGLMQAQNQEQVCPILFSGFIHAVYNEDSNKACQFQKSVLQIPELKSHFVYLLGSTPIETWGVKKLIEVARSGELEAWQFERISFGQRHERISDIELGKILSAINKLEKGAFSTIRILEMRFFIDKNNDYNPHEVLRSAGREAIRQILSMHQEDIEELSEHELELVAPKCLSPSSPKNEIHEIVKLLCEGVASFRLSGFKLREIIRVLIINFPEEILNSVFTEGRKEDTLERYLLRGQISHHDSLVNHVRIDRLLKWCDGNQERIMKVARAVSSYVFIGNEKNPLDDLQPVKLSDHIKALLEVAEKPTDIVEIMIDEMRPSCWVGSLAAILEVRSKAFAELLVHPLEEVRDFASIKFSSIEKSIQESRIREAEWHNKREQRFEYD